jgi:D-psicose/D-tagatose/L-ribulose 3-epimerase
MKISISNIAWDAAEDDAVAALLDEFGVKGIEVAPTKVWPSPEAADDASARTYREFWGNRGVEIVAFQALLFGRPELCLFTNDKAREKTFDYLCAIIRLAEKLGARALVFGSPKNRVAGDLPASRAFDIAAEFFWRLGEVAARHNTRFCIEPNPAAYGCDFVRTAAEGLALVRRVNHPGFRLHLDAGAMTINGEDYGRVIADCFEWTAHFHVSEPNLEMVGRQGTPHRRIARTLRELGYQGWVSIEMRGGLTAPNTAAVRAALDFVTATYR